jgi:hypothetical protein
MLAISGLDVAFVSAIAAIAAAIAAPLSSWLVAIANNRHDRWVKTYDDLRDAYLRLLRQIYRLHTSTSAFVQMLDADDPGVYGGQSAIAERPDEQVDRLALAGAFASGPVVKAVEDWDTARQEVIELVKNAKFGTEGERRDSAAAIRDAQDKLREPVRRIRDAIRADLRKQS